MTNELKEYVDILYKTCDLIEESPYYEFIVDEDNYIYKNPQRENLDFDLTRFFMLLSNSEGIFNQNEIDFISECTNKYLPASTLKSLYDDGDDFYKKNYYGLMPGVIEIFWKFDLCLKSHGTEAHFCDSFVNGLRLIGFEFLNCNGKASISEEEHLNSLLKPIEKYCDAVNDLHNSRNVETKAPKESNSQPKERFIKLKELFDCGLISEEEYNKRKSEILSEI